MSEQPDNLMLVYVRRFDEKLDRLAFDMQDLTIRMTATEEAVVGVSRRLDRIETRLDRMERRLDLVETSP